MGHLIQSLVWLGERAISFKCLNPKTNSRHWFLILMWLYSLDTIPYQQRNTTLNWYRVQLETWYLPNEPWRALDFCGYARFPTRYRGSGQVVSYIYDKRGRDFSFLVDITLLSFHAVTSTTSILPWRILFIGGPNSKRIPLHITLGSQTKMGTGIPYPNKQPHLHLIFTFWHESNTRLSLSGHTCNTSKHFDSPRQSHVGLVASVGPTL